MVSPKTATKIHHFLPELCCCLTPSVFLRGGHIDQFIIRDVHGLNV